MTVGPGHREAAMTIRSRLVGTTAALLLAGGLAAAPASAAVLENLRFQDSGSEPFPFCSGINATTSWDDRVHVLVKTAGRERLVYFAANVHGTRAFTNLATGKSYTNVYNFTDRDMKVTDNGDGTLTITISTVGTNRWYGADGNLLFVVAGHFSFQIMVDHGGTPGDPSDDVEIEDSFTVVKEVGIDQTAGRDFCADLLQFTS
jgi:hypothetical protein